MCLSSKMPQKLFLVCLVYLVGPSLTSRGYSRNEHSALWQYYGVKDSHVRQKLLSEEYGGNNVSETATTKLRNREGRILSLFSIVRFANSACQSTSTFNKAVAGSTVRNGTCLTSVECGNQGGTAAGSCAGGFGVCCVLTASTSGDTISRNCTYIQNPTFPSAYADTATVSYTVSKCSCDVCFLRLDFECFTSTASQLTTEAAGGACTDSFTVTSPSGFPVPTICGDNTGQHIYVDMGANCGDTVTLNFAFGTPANPAVRTWDIKASQIPCGSNYSPPDGCLQYLNELDGRISTFNFAGADNHLANQQYSICIRQAQGFCCVQYMVCADALSMSLGSVANANIATMAFQDDLCSMDYIGIEGSADTCNQSGVTGATTNRFCGMFLNTVQVGQNIPICDCTSPFQVDVVTDAVADNTGGANTISRSRGTCLEYTQIPCAN